MSRPIKVPRDLVDLVVFSLPCIEESPSVCIPSWDRSHVVGVDEGGSCGLSERKFGLVICILSIIVPAKARAAEEAL
jgi:hypothetical protein